MRSIYMTLILVTAVMAQGCASAMAPVPTNRGPMMAPVVAAVVPAPVEVEAPSVATIEAPPTPAPVETPPGTADRERAVDWMVGFMKRSAPPGRQTFYAEAQESKEETLQRYHEIANAIIDVVYDPSAKTLFRGSSGRARTASVVLAIMLHESGFMKNVDFGVGKYGRGDHGNSWCLLQLNVGSMGTGHTMRWNIKEDRVPRLGDNPADIFEGFTGPELVSDRRNCVREGLKAMRISFTACAHNVLEEKLNAYASGNCDDGEEKSAARMKTAIKFWNETKGERTFSDKAIVALVATERQTQVPVPDTPKQPDPVKAKPEEPKKDEPRTPVPVQSVAQTER